MSTTWLVQCLGGSSPLARGLPSELLTLSLAAGIIPARAGFTVSRYASSRDQPDHPRSRGVYDTPSRPCVGRGGSSPLARGLLIGFPPCQAYSGIIPARAGFTERLSYSSRVMADHPRSRGVYPSYSAGPGTVPGSSPLARGLQPQYDVLRIQPGIIPARAGFTARHFSRTSPMKDHPRSRGVYPWRKKFPCSISGIIPARAGFTVSAQRVGRGDQDHPRSRGVYGREGKRAAGSVGSSPLARGLPNTY